jgi:glyoxylase-like metal-dependent hydrolase (beta-lactamase superfamily II)
LRIGEYDCLAVNDGSARGLVGSMVAQAVPRDQLATALREYHLELQGGEVEVNYNCVIVNAGAQRILIDTGGGALSAEVGQLVPRMRSAGVDPADIAIVILSHGHFDHIGGVTDSDGTLAFPNARYVMARAEWDFWTGEPDLTRLEVDDDAKRFMISFARERLALLGDRLELVEDGAEVAPGVQALLAPGHTPGHMATVVCSAGHYLVIAGDAAYHPVQFQHPTWHSPFDSLPDQVAGTRRHLLQWATKQHALILAYHFPFPGLGRVQPQGEGWEWQPMALSLPR